MNALSNSLARVAAPPAAHGRRREGGHARGRALKVRWEPCAAQMPCRQRGGRRREVKCVPPPPSRWSARAAAGLHGRSTAQGATSCRWALWRMCRVATWRAPARRPAPTAGRRSSACWQASRVCLLGWATAAGAPWWDGGDKLDVGSFTQQRPPGSTAVWLVVARLLHAATTLPPTAGETYDSFDPELVDARINARRQADARQSARAGASGAVEAGLDTQTAPPTPGMPQLSGCAVACGGPHSAPFKLAPSSNAGCCGG